MGRPWFDMPWTRKDNLTLAWLAELAAVTCDARGSHSLASTLRAGAAQLRRDAVGND
jgi:hypothetical protein